MAFVELDYNRLTQDELIEFVRLIAAEGKAENLKIEDPIVLKYLQTLESDAGELESTHAVITNDEKNKHLQEADRVRDRALSVFRRLMQVYELTDDNSPEAIAYEYLDSLWMKKYETLPYLNLMVETTGIDDLLFDLNTEKYSQHIHTLNLVESVMKIKKANDAFKLISGDSSAVNDMKPTYDARALRIELIETLKLFVNYVKALAESSDNKSMQQLYKGIQQTTSKYSGQLTTRHAGNQLDIEHH